jgi:hypothetical protein
LRLAVYVNPYDAIVLRQYDYGEERFVVIRPEHARAVAAKMIALADSIMGDHQKRAA